MSVFVMVDDTRLELVTSRTSSGCATSCANRPDRLAGCIVHDKTKNVKLFFKKISDEKSICDLTANCAAMVKLYLKYTGMPEK